ncbi:acetoacetate--CoA ligase [Nakamurella deserti]|uniref:acetoacetate--CoA ligase n=1 Tax=Nakamurella deserti TaxID=2164074 RepID=UPI000DBE0397|nr:acetoacetate--CoA ligase [Nakamurella deserti]
MDERTEPPVVLWAPDEQRTTRIGVFAEELATRTGRAFPTYADLWSYSTTEVGAFWAALADHFGVRWHHPAIGDLADARMPGARWFPGGTLNYAEHALADLPGRTDDTVVAIVAAEDGTAEPVTLAELRALVGAAENGLRRAGVGTGDRVVALVPNGLHALVGFLATAALGAVWSSCSPDFGPGSVIDRFRQIEPTVLLAVDGYRYGGRVFDVSATVAQLRAAVPGMTLVHIPVLGTPVPDGATDWDTFTAEAGAPVFVPVPFAAPLWVLYSSGTTGLPKPIVQSVGGILLEHLKVLALQSDLGPGSVFLWFTTTGWMMWNYLIGGLLVGATIVLFDGNPGHPDLGVLWRLAQQWRVTYFGTSAPWITACRKAGLTPGTDHDLGALQVVGSTGSPLDADGFGWLHDAVGEHLQIVSLSGGTDLCTAVVGGAPTVPVWAGEISCRALGAKVEAFSPTGDPLVGEVGELVITAPMPSMPVAFWGDDDGTRLRDAYFAEYPGVWRHGDWIRVTDRGSCVIEGRSDATLNRGGVRMGTAEFYRVVDAVPQVRDALVVDTSGAAEGELLLFVVLADGADPDAVTARLRRDIRADLSPRHVPSRVIPVPAIPRTLNGKKLEVPVKRILAGADVAGAVSRDALADPAGFDAFLAAARQAHGGAAPR